MTGLSAPFPYYGGKARWADAIWERFGAPDVYVEPFAGSLAVLLANPSPAKREVVCDNDGMICNFWRAVAADPEMVARHADYPTIHQDLTARHAWLRAWRAENADRLSQDPEFFDARAAGWWVWGISLWIGGGWCTHSYNRRPNISASSPTGGPGISVQRRDKSPMTRGASWGGAGVSAQRDRYPGGDKRPRINDDLGGRGCSAQRDKMPALTGSRVSISRGVTRDQIPHVCSDHRGGAAVTAQALRTGALIDWFEALAARLKRVIVLNRDWTAALTPSVLADTPSGPGAAINRCILLDPPYLTEKRQSEGKEHGGLYPSDFDGTSDDTATAAFKWAVENGERFRIAYFCHEGDFDAPSGWISETRRFKGHNRSVANTRDCVMFSPACEARQGNLFERIAE